MLQVHMGQFLESVGDKVPTLVGIKFTSTNLDEISEVIHAENGRFAAFLGSNEVRNQFAASQARITRLFQIIPAASATGMDSFMPSAANLFPELVQEVIKFSREGDFAAAKTKQEKLLRTIKKLSQLGNGLALFVRYESPLFPYFFSFISICLILQAIDLQP